LKAGIVTSLSALDAYPSVKSGRGSRGCEKGRKNSVVVFLYGYHLLPGSDNLDILLEEKEDRW